MKYEVTGADFNGATDQTDRSVFWVKCEDALQLQYVINGCGGRVCGELPDNTAPDFDVRIETDLHGAERRRLRAVLLDCVAAQTPKQAEDWARIARKWQDRVEHEEGKKPGGGWTTAELVDAERRASLCRDYADAAWRAHDKASGFAGLTGT